MSEKLTNEDIFRYVKRLTTALPAAYKIGTPEKIHDATKEIQAIFTLLLLNFLTAKDNIDEVEITAGDGTSVKLADLFTSVVEGSMQSLTKGLSVAEVMQEYVRNASLIEQGRFAGRQFEASESDTLDPKIKKKRALIAVHTACVIATRDALVSCVLYLRELGNLEATQLADELSNPNVISSAMDRFDILTAAKVQALQSVIGASDDGSAHLVAVLDLLYDQRPAATLPELIKLSRPYVATLMTSQYGWRIQLLDTILLADRNPYEIKDNKIVESETCAKFINFVEGYFSKKRDSQGFPVLKANDVPGFFSRCLDHLLDGDSRQKQKQKDQAMVLFELLFEVSKAQVLLTNPGLRETDQAFFSIVLAFFFTLIDNKQHDEILDLLKDAKKTKKGLIDITTFTPAEFSRALALSLVPLKVFSAQSEKRAWELSVNKLEDGGGKQPAPKCSVLYAPQGLDNWLDTVQLLLSMVENN